MSTGAYSLPRPGSCWDGCVEASSKRGADVASETKRKEGAQMGYVINCVDGMQVRGETMDELRKNTEQHIAEYHKGEDLDVDAVMATARVE
jgi:hypothetical protein